MVRAFLSGLMIILLLAIVAACGGAEEPDATEPPAAAPTQAPTNTPAPEPTDTPEAMMEEEEEEDAMMADVDPALMAAAAERAGGPGAFYIGDLSQLVGPAPAEGLGDANDMVNLEGLEREKYIFELQYYADLVEKANFTDPTPLTYDGEPIEIQFACINRTVAPCELFDNFFRKEIEERTNGKVLIEITSFPELGIAGPDSLSLITNGSLSFAEISSSYVSGAMPEAELQILFGVYETHEHYMGVQEAIGPLVDELFEENSEGGKVISHMWISGADQFFFCKEPIETLSDFEGRKVRSHGSALSDWIEGFGAAAQFVAFAEVYTALERGVLDCGVTVAFASVAQRWYEVTTYMVGPLATQAVNTLIMSPHVWNELPPDIQQIFVEEGARYELEGLRVTPAWNEVWIPRNVEAGMVFQEFTPELLEHQKNVVAPDFVIPGFVRRQDEANRPAMIDLFNEKIAPIVGLRIRPDGTGERIQ